jgi:hypothetical protein
MANIEQLINKLTPSDSIITLPGEALHCYHGVDKDLGGGAIFMLILPERFQE